MRHPSVDGFTKIALVHHHFDKYQPYSSSLADKLYHAFEARTLKLHGKKKVQKVFCELGVTGVLHGHTHIEETYSDRGLTYSSTAMNPVRSKAEARTAHDASQLCFNEIAVDAKGKIRARMRRISYQETRLTYFRSSKIIREPDPLEQEG